MGASSDPTVSGNKILAKGRRNRRRRPVIIGNGLSQMFAVAKLADMVNRVKPEGPRQRETRPAGLQISGFRMCEGQPCAQPSTIPTARCGPACRVVWEGRSRKAPPYPDCPSVVRDSQSPLKKKSGPEFLRGPISYGAWFTSDRAAITNLHRHGHRRCQTARNGAAGSSARAVRAAACWTRYIAPATLRRPHTGRADAVVWPTR
jgi:hypothetical protein